ncbi:MAG: GntR family transcriptional regulator [Candidatus Hydrogenedentes bacterium]|nr:GntR family transcriptional regulator [Candidatus Hydrogenedentota bacterium]
MFDSINIDSSVAVYVQIENLVQFAITAGDLKPGDQLPSVREMSERLKVNPNTVAKAYRDLEIMGFVRPVRGMAFYIQEDAVARCREQCRRTIISRIHEVVGEAKAAGFQADEVKEAANRSFASESGPYGAVPDSVIGLASGGGGRRRSK